MPGIGVEMPKAWEQGVVGDDRRHVTDQQFHPWSPFSGPIWIEPCNLRRRTNEVAVVEMVVVDLVIAPVTGGSANQRAPGRVVIKVFEILFPSKRQPALKTMSDGLDGLTLCWCVGQGFGDSSQGGEGAQLLSFPVGVLGRIKCEALLGKLGPNRSGDVLRGGKMRQHPLHLVRGGETLALEQLKISSDRLIGQSGLATLRYQMLPLVRVQGVHRFPRATFHRFGCEREQRVDCPLISGEVHVGSNHVTVGARPEQIERAGIRIWQESNGVIVSVRMQLDMSLLILGPCGSSRPKEPIRSPSNGNSETCSVCTLRPHDRAARQK